MTMLDEPAVVMPSDVTEPAAHPERGHLTRTTALTGAAAALFLLPHAPGAVGRFTRGVSFDFLGLLLESLPFLLAGAALGALVERRVLHRLLPAARRNPHLAVLLAPFVGAALPLCDCGIVPLARRLRGAGGAALNAFIAGAPLTNPIVVISTVLAFPGQPVLVMGRFACGIAVAFLVALLALKPAGNRPTDPPPASSSEPARESLRTHVAGELGSSLPILILGCLAAAVLKTALPSGAFALLADQPLLAAAAMMLLAFAMSLCSQADAFVAAALPVGTLPRLAFLVLGPQLDIKTALLYGRSFGRRWLYSYAAVVVPGVLVATVLWTSWFPA